MTKAELIDRIYRRKDLPHDITKKTIAQIVDAAFREVGDYFVKARSPRGGLPRFTYPGFGSFTRRRREARIGRNPRTGQTVEIPPTATLAFTPAQEFKSLLNSEGTRRKVMG